MAGQLTYGYATQSGLAGGIVDLSNKVVDSRVFEMTAGTKALFGLGVVLGSVAGTNVNIPDEDSKATEFEGVLVNGHTTQYDLDGILSINDNATVGVMRAGRIWARVDSEATIDYGEPLYLIPSGENAGRFTNNEEGNLSIQGRFLHSGNTAGLHAVELFAGR